MRANNASASRRNTWVAYPWRITSKLPSNLPSSYHYNRPDPSLAEDLKFAPPSPPDAVKSFWGKQLLRMTKLVSDSTQTDLSWNKLIPPEIAQAAGRVRLAPLMSLMAQRNLGGPIGIQQFLFGFRITGILSRRYAFPPSDKLSNKSPTDVNKLAQSDSQRFHDRDKKSGYKNATPLWEEAVAHRGKVWLAAPFAIASTHDPFTIRDAKLNIAFRFVVSQAAKLRACDDLRHSLTNLDFVAQDAHYSGLLAPFGRNVPRY